MTMLETLAGFSARMIETGLKTMGTALGTMNSVIGGATGLPPTLPPRQPELDGPHDLDRATSDLAGRLARLIRYWSVAGNGSLLNASSELWTTARKSFGGIDFSDPRRWLALPLQLPLSFGTLLAQESLRGLHMLEIVGPTQTPRFIMEVGEAFLDIPVYVCLQYKEEIERFRHRVLEDPEDYLARLELGRSYIKCGRYEEAISELAIVAKSPALRHRALYESVVANCRAGHYERAAKEGAAAMAEGIRDGRIQYWTWIAAQKIGGYPAETLPEDRVEMAAGKHPTALRYKDVAAEIGLDKTGGGRGIAVLDIDGDGYMDVLILAISGGISVYRNNRDGTFRDVSVGSGLDSCVNTWAVAIGDYNNDGLSDVFVTRLGFFWGNPALYRNNGDGTFTNVTKEAGIDVWTPGFTASWVDYDCDGNLDLFVPGNIGGLFARPRPDCLYHNNGDGTFTELAEKAGISSRWTTIGACWGDYDNDGYPDLFLSSAIGPPSLYHNNGDGTFTDVSRESGVDIPGLGFVAQFCDYDDDGWLDIVQFVWCPYDDMIFSLRHGYGPPGGKPLRIFHNNRNGTFTDVSRDVGITESWGTMSGNAGDLNNDGYLDLALGNGGPQMDRTEPIVVYENSRGRFNNVTFSAGLPPAGKSHGLNLADLHGDGRLSIMSGSGGMYPGEMLTVSVFRPIELPGNYLNVRLVGTRSNRDAIGARVKLTAGGRDQHRLAGGGTGFGCLPLEQHFGLGGLTNVDSLEIWWPSGLKQRIGNLPFNDTIRITEGNDSWESIHKK